MKRLLLSLVSLLCLTQSSYADEGMWLLPLIDQNMAAMKEKGLVLQPRNINGIQKNGKALGNAIVQFGSGCSGAVISPNGLVLTNQHCAYNYVHNMSTVDNDIVMNGSWAMSMDEEIPVPGLSVTFVRVMSDVTDEILKGTDTGLNKEDREYIIESNKNNLLAYYQNHYPGNRYKHSLTNYFDGELYLLTITETYPDVRLVGLPPESIGKFGGEAVNWHWPRYTADFALFRVYSAPDGSPAAYSEDNVPYETKSFLNISSEGYKEGDFAMVLGFPAATQRYMPDSEVEFFVNTRVKPLVDVMGELIPILEKGMSGSMELSFKYGPKYTEMSNAYKKYKGMLEGLDKYGVNESAEKRDKEFEEWVAKNPLRSKGYENTLQNVYDYDTMHLNTAVACEYVYQTFINGMDLLKVTQNANRLRGTGEITSRTRERAMELVQMIYKDYDADIDRELAYAAIKMVVEKVPQEFLPQEFVKELNIDYKGDIEAYVDYLYDRTSFNSPETFMEQWELSHPDRWENDPALKLLSSVQQGYRDLQPTAVNARDNGMAMRLYQTALGNYTRALRDAKILKYPNASRNMRLTYGAVEGYSVPDQSSFNYNTTIEDMMKYQKDNGIELPDKFVELYDNKAYTDFTSDSIMNVNFLTSTDITGGNSGSPVLNSKGDIIGLVFDNNWEGLTGDLQYADSVNRTINVDIKYILYIIDKYAGASNIMDELTIIDRTKNDIPDSFEPEFKY